MPCPNRPQLTPWEPRDGDGPSRVSWGVGTGSPLYPSPLSYRAVTGCSPGEAEGTAMRAGPGRGKRQGRDTKHPAALSRVVRPGRSRRAPPCLGFRVCSTGSGVVPLTDEGTEAQSGSLPTSPGVRSKAEDTQVSQLRPGHPCTGTPSPHPASGRRSTAPGSCSALISPPAPHQGSLPRPHSSKSAVPGQLMSTQITTSATQGYLRSLMET